MSKHKSRVSHNITVSRALNVMWMDWRFGLGIMTLLPIDDVEVDMRLNQQKYEKLTFKQTSPLNQLIGCLL